MHKAKENTQCSKCNEIKPINEFYRNKDGSKLRTFCNKCNNKDRRNRKYKSIESLMGTRFSGIKDRCKIYKIIFNITLDDLIDLYYSQDGKCFYTDEIMNISPGRCRETMEVDRIIPELGYIKGNIVLCVSKFNFYKLNWTLNQIKLWMPGAYQKIIDYWNKIDFDYK